MVYYTRAPFFPSVFPQRNHKGNHHCQKKESTGLLRVPTFGFWPCCRSLKIAGQPTEPPPYLLRFQPRLIPSDIDCGSLFCFQLRLSAPTFLIVDNVSGGFLMKFVRFPALFLQCGAVRYCDIATCPSNNSLTLGLVMFN